MDESLRSSHQSVDSIVMISDVKHVLEEGEEVYTARVLPANDDETPVTLKFTEPKPIDSGTFGTVSTTTLLHSNEVVAIKSVYIDKTSSNRELQILKTVRHCNIIELKYYFFEKEREKIKMNLILEYLPQNLYKILSHYHRYRIKLHPTYIKVFIYQVFKALNYLHTLGICHRDIKPQNLLLDYSTGELKLCDFGSAKRLVEGEPNVAYICSRYYRAPELLFGSTEYTTKIDVWSAGCILAELLVGRVLFAANSTLEMLVEIIKILGSPNSSQIYQMNPKAPKFNLPTVRPRRMSLLFNNIQLEAVDLISKILVWEPEMRITSIYACCHPFFDELRELSTKLPSGSSLPFCLFHITEDEIATHPELRQILVPQWYYEIILPKPVSSNANSSSTD